MSVAAVLSRDFTRAQAFCAQTAKGAIAFDDRTAFLSAVDAVYIATPSNTHLTEIVPALNAGRPVLCEKPLTSSPQDTERAIAYAREARVLLMEAVWTLTLPAFQALAAQVSGMKTRTRRLTFDFSYPLHVNQGTHYLDPITGGVLLDRGVYAYAAAIVLLGSVSRQHAFVTFDDTGLDRAAEIRTEHESGACGLLTLSFDVLGSNRLEIATALGLAQLGPPSLAAEALDWSVASSRSGTEDAGRDSLKTWLKSAPLLRKLKWKRDQARGQFFSFGASIYLPLLKEFSQAAAMGTESATVPLSLSYDIATLVEAARKAPP